MASQPSLDREFGKTFSWDIDMLSGYPYRFIETAEGASPVTVWKCRLREPLRDRLRQSGAKALWIQGWQVAAYWQAVREAKAAGIEVWLRGESNDLAPTPMWKRPLKRLALGRLFARVDRFLYIGTANKRLYQSFGVPEARLYSAPYAVDNERFAQQASALRSQRTELRRRWGIRRRCVLRPVLRKVHCEKAADGSGRGGAHVAGGWTVANIHLLFVGSGELGGPLRQACDVVYDAERAEPSDLLSHHASLRCQFRPPAGVLCRIPQSDGNFPRLCRRRLPGAAERPRRDLGTGGERGAGERPAVPGERCLRMRGRSSGR